MLREIVLGSDAVDYLRAYFTEGTTLANLLARLPLDQGRIVAYVPQSADSNQITHYASGGLVREEDRGAPGRYAICFVSNYLNASDMRCAVFEDINAVPGNATNYNGNDIPYVTFADEVYPFVVRSPNTWEAIAQVIAFAASYRLVCALWESATVPPLFTGTEVGLDLLESIASQCEHIAILAYDGEGFLLWSRDPGA